MRGANQPARVASVFRLGRVPDAGVMLAGRMSPQKTSVVSDDDTTISRRVCHVVWIVSVL
jgi:hypothetical protein